MCRAGLRRPDVAGQGGPAARGEQHRVDDPAVGRPVLEPRVDAARDDGRARVRVRLAARIGAGQGEPLLLVGPGRSGHLREHRRRVELRLALLADAQVLRLGHRVDEHRRPGGSSRKRRAEQHQRAHHQGEDRPLPPNHRRGNVSGQVVPDRQFPKVSSTGHLRLASGAGRRNPRAARGTNMCSWPG